MVQRLSELTIPFIQFSLARRPFAARPELGALAMEAVNSWATVEDSMLHMFVHLLGGDESLAVDIYLGLEGDGPKRSVIATAAKARLTPEHFELFSVLLELATTNAKARNKLVHRAWQDSPQLPDALLLKDAKAWMRGMNKGIESSDEIEIYRADDFKNITKANDRLFDFWTTMYVMVKYRPTGPEFEQLCAEPEIRERLGHRKARRDRASNAKPSPQPPGG